MFTPVMSMIIRDENGNECQRLGYYRDTGKNRFAGHFTGAYSMEADLLFLKHLLHETFDVFPKDKEKSYRGDERCKQEETMLHVSLSSKKS